MLPPFPNVDTTADATHSPEVMDARVAVLNNYFRAHHTVVYQAINRRISNLNVLLSTPMEPNRSWDAEWDELDVTVQKNWTFTAKWRHSLGFAEDNFIHFPVDTVKQLKLLKPDVVFSYEFGVRTLLSSRYCRRNRIPLVMVGNMSELIERERGFLRRRLRHFLRRRVDFCTYNGPSCKRYLLDLGVAEDRLLFFPYAYDCRKTHQGPVTFSRDGVTRLMFCGVLDPRKGIRQLMEQLDRWTSSHAERPIELYVCGTGGDAQTQAADHPPNLTIHWLGHCDNRQLAETYALADICVFPSLADEWGLVTVESLASGTPVLGSSYAQSVESLIQNGVNGWAFRPDKSEEFYSVLDKALRTDATTLECMASNCRESVRHISPEQSAEHFLNALRVAMDSRTKSV